MTKLRHWHFWISLVLVCALVPALRSQHLPVRFDWITLGVAYWLILAAQAIFVAAVLAVIGLPRAELWDPLVARYRERPIRAVVLLLYFAILLWATTWMKAVILTVDTLALLELRERQRSQGLRRAAAAIFPAAAYLFFGFLMVLAYNYAVVSARFNFATDPALASIDRVLLRGHAVWDLTHWAVKVFPVSFFRFLEFIYFGMFPQIGAAIVLTALIDGGKRALQFVGAILTSYYFALAIFYLWPAQGPYYLCPTHFATFPSTLQSYTIQKTLIPHALALWHHEPITRISADYFIGFPCMHIVQPLIVMWFLRRWKRMVWALAAYDVVLVVAVLLLEMHYVIDFLVGLLVAAAAIALSGGPVHRNEETAQ